jgi:thioredoxin 1
MFKRTSYFILTLMLLLTIATAGCTSKSNQTTTVMSWSEAISNGKPTLAEFGRGTCIPCKDMKPILEEIAAEYVGKLNVMIISVDEYSVLTRQFGIMAIPTQVFLDKDGKEVSRHVGFFAKKDIVSTLTAMGIE